MSLRSFIAYGKLNFKSFIIQACLSNSVPKEIFMDFVKDFRERKEEARQKGHAE